MGFWVWELANGEITTSTIHPTRDFGLATHPLTSVRGSTPELNALTFRALLTPGAAVPPHLSAPTGPDAPNIDAIRDFVLLNAAALLKVSGKASTYQEGVELARKSIESGEAMRAFEAFIVAGREAMRDAGAVEPEDDGGVAAKGGAVSAWLHSQKEKEKEAEKAKRAE
ncbi:hypothetical protein QFC24_000673 [Naganishia onofrii]|uniref:Uncharacterized protein n=1 Tax=Naganishia onofrii TaxID=1851511 RepID=A0ACC2XWI5_9TREE|nr:hypothetical protein QFC24_000673 [Naganishia onofrii]